MTSSRIEKIESMLEDDPHDTFLIYSLALEQEKIQNYADSEAGLRRLMADETPYVPAFFMLSQHLAKRDRVNGARTVLRDGIEEARKQGNSHAAGEMSEFLASLGSEGE